MDGRCALFIDFEEQPDREAILDDNPFPWTVPQRQCSSCHEVPLTLQSPLMIH